MIALLAGIVGPPLDYLHAHEGRAVVAAAIVGVVAGYFLTGPHGRWTR